MNFTVENHSVQGGPEMDQFTLPIPLNLMNRAFGKATESPIRGSKVTKYNVVLGANSENRTFEI